jgi:prevent-host-death family protein
LASARLDVHDRHVESGIAKRVRHLDSDVTRAERTGSRRAPVPPSRYLTNKHGHVTLWGMTRVNIAEAKARLSELIDAALQGEDVVIARRNKPVVKLTAVKTRVNRPQFGMFKGRIRMSVDFDEPLQDFAEYMPKMKRSRKR